MKKEEKRRIEEILKKTKQNNVNEIIEKEKAHEAEEKRKAEEIMKDVYNHILAISTIAGIVTAAIALLMLNFSKSDRTVTESRAWLKRIIVTWVILNGLGFIMAYITPFFADGRWNG